MHVNRRLAFGLVGVTAAVIALSAVGVSAASTHRGARSTSVVRPRPSQLVPAVSGPPSGWHLCGGERLDSQDSYSYSGNDFVQRNSYTQIYTGVANTNVLGWIGDVTLDLDGLTGTARNVSILPTQTKWYVSGAGYNKTKEGNPFTVTVNSTSDAVSLAIVTYAPYCSDAGEDQFDSEP
jgi:hypothetical protein